MNPGVVPASEAADWRSPEPTPVIRAPGASCGWPPLAACRLNVLQRKTIDLAPFDLQNVHSADMCRPVAG